MADGRCLCVAGVGDNRDTILCLDVCPQQPWGVSWGTALDLLSHGLHAVQDCGLSLGRHCMRDDERAFSVVRHIIQLLSDTAYGCCLKGVRALAIWYNLVEIRL